MVCQLVYDRRCAEIACELWIMLVLGLGRCWFSLAWSYCQGSTYLSVHAKESRSTEGWLATPFPDWQEGQPRIHGAVAESAYEHLPPFDLVVSRESLASVAQAIHAVVLKPN